MSKLKLDSSQDCDVLRKAITKALGYTAWDELGIDIKVSRMTYGNGSVTVKLDCTTLNADGKVESKEEKALKEWVSMGLLEPIEESDIGREFVCKGRTFILEGYSPRSPKRPFICRDKKSGGSFKFEQKGILRLLGKKAPSVVS